MKIDFIGKKPRCFGDFNIVLVENNQDGIEFVKGYLECNCNNKELNIYASHGESMYLAPVFLECPICGYKELIFNPENHGWDGENGDNCSMVGAEDPNILSGCPMKVVAEFSYQGLDNYEDLAEDGIENLEDYFDTFNLYGLDENGSICASIDYECA